MQNSTYFAQNIISIVPVNSSILPEEVESILDIEFAPIVWLGVLIVFAQYLESEYESNLMSLATIPAWRPQQHIGILAN